MAPKFTNALIRETSPYLLQHAHNPVNWEAWSTEILQRAKKENKLLLISIGYAACHWCHVMEHECFEDIEVSEVMNAHFINIKVDREERPDIDKIYMDALQMMTGNGGWPLNIVALPDGRPFWGATYVKKEQWINTLLQLQKGYATSHQKVVQYAENMANGLIAINKIVPASGNSPIDLAQIGALVTQWKTYFDTFLGGYKRAPKFMMPVNLEFLMYYAHTQQDPEIWDYVDTTLKRMAWGGIFDHVGGGFSRYSVDAKWHVPHFEKMLYDNALLVSLYAKAYAKTKNQLYRQTVVKTIGFLKEELLGPEFGFYASLDADSTNEHGALQEGAYYTWRAGELKALLKDRYPVFAKFFNINSYGLWEENLYVLIRDGNAQEIQMEFQMDPEKLQAIITACLDILKEERKKRNKPRLDDKILSSWNGLALKGLTDAYRYLQDPAYLDLAKQNAAFIVNNLFDGEDKLYHNYNKGKRTISGFLEDYASIIDGFIGLYEVSLEETWIHRAHRLAQHAISHFYDPKNELFHFTNKDADVLIRRTYEVEDNVIPASNSLMAQNLLKLSKFFMDPSYKEMVLAMVQQMDKVIKEHPQSHANWLHVALSLQVSFKEVAIVGPDHKEAVQKMGSVYAPNSIMAATKQGSSLPILQGKKAEKETLFYICEAGMCKQPVTHVDTAINMVKGMA